MTPKRPLSSVFDRKTLLLCPTDLRQNSAPDMKNVIGALLSLVLVLVLLTPAQAVLRPRFPEKPSPPFAGDASFRTGGGFPPMIGDRGSGRGAHRCKK